MALWLKLTQSGDHPDWQYKRKRCEQGKSQKTIVESIWKIKQSGNHSEHTQNTGSWRSGEADHGNLESEAIQCSTALKSNLEDNPICKKKIRHGT